MTEIASARSIFNPSASELEESVTNTLKRCKRQFQLIKDVQQSDVSFENVLALLLQYHLDFRTEFDHVELLSMVSVDKDMRDISCKLLNTLSEADVDFSMNQDVFEKLLILREHPDVKVISAEKRKALDYLICEGRRNGLHLDKDTQINVRNLMKEIGCLSNDYMHNLNEENTVLYFSQAELAGMSEEFLGGLEKVDDKYAVTLKYPHYVPCIKQCRVPSTRKLLERAYSSRCKEPNTAILEKLIALKAEKAKLLGYSTHATFTLEKQMVKTPETVSKFLKGLAEKITPLVHKEREMMLKYKKKECGEFGFEYDNVINAWDRLYYMNKVVQNEYYVNHDKLQQYFPIEVVTKGLFEIYQKVLGVIFTPVTDVQLWHPDVKMFTVTDTDTGALLGHIYMDMYPREGKYSHACCQPLHKGCLEADGSRRLPSCCLMCNFTKPTIDKPALLTHTEVIVYFHEFGHAMHNIFAQTETALFSNTNVEKDFLEAPSQMLENWCWSYETLSMMSSHYKTGETIPREEVATLAASRKANSGHFIMRQIVLSTLDQQIHSIDTVDTAKLYSELLNTFLNIEAMVDTNVAASFIHIVKLYDSQYYSYIWSMVSCMDMFVTRFEKEGLLNTKTGQEYKNSILKPGGSLEGAEMLRNFLGRDPDSSAFLNTLGL